MGFINSTRPFGFPDLNGAEFLTEEEYSQVSVLFDQLMPSNHEDGVPGASDAKAARFLSQLLALDGDAYYQILDWRSIYRDGLKQLDRASLHNFKESLSGLSPPHAKELLGELEKGKLKGLPAEFNQTRFFRMLLEHCVKGCFSDPRWGGNENGIMWRWLGWIQPAEDLDFSGAAE